MSNDDEYDRRVEAMWRRVRERVGPDCLVDYSAYQTAEEPPEDNLDQVPIAGPVRFRADPDRFWGGDRSRAYQSPVLDSPSWLELCAHANDMMLATNDHHHCFLEGVELVGRDGEVQLAEFCMGS